ncbi:hypothetical protein [Sandarakinorhabdus glacialis]|uniref:hypothetical protein n=1 Tax=Sandarakinorhabdus glacialis TaxID=1614636 RepID=UPI001663F56F|nr:hypothetical protein [Polymorphobacter glacialis]
MDEGAIIKMRKGIVRVTSAIPFEEQPSLLPLRIRDIMEANHLGRDIAFRAVVYGGQIYVCKDDDGARRVRATELICTSIADYLGIATAPFSVIEDNRGYTYFGSLENISTAALATMKSYLSWRQLGELGQPLSKPGRFLSSVHALDLLFNNRDRYPSNFILVPDGQDHRLCAIDFASARFSDLTTIAFPAPTDSTLRLGKILRELHGGHIGVTFEIIDHVAAMPMDVFDRILQTVPSDWISDDEKRVIRGAWSDLANGVRLPALRAGLRNGSLA